MSITLSDLANIVSGGIIIFVHVNGTYIGVIPEGSGFKAKSDDIKLFKKKIINAPVERLYIADGKLNVEIEV